MRTGEESTKKRRANACLYENKSVKNIDTNVHCKCIQFFKQNHKITVQLTLFSFSLFFPQLYLLRLVLLFPHKVRVAPSPFWYFLETRTHNKKIKYFLMENMNFPFADELFIFLHKSLIYCCCKQTLACVGWKQVLFIRIGRIFHKNKSGFSIRIRQEKKCRHSMLIFVENIL